MNNPLSIVDSRPDERNHASPRLAIVTGSRGQDGSYLRDLIGFEKTLGCINPKQKSTNGHFRNEISIDLGDKKVVLDLLKQIRPKSIFHLAAKHGPSTKMTYEPEDVLAMNRLHVEATKNFLESIDQLGLDTHLVVAGSSRVFTPIASKTRINELSEPNPSDHYGESKLQAWELVKHHRQESGTKASFLILFNHESPRRPSGYFSNDVARAIKDYQTGKATRVLVRDADFLGDWSDARDVVMLMEKVASTQISNDFVVASGQLRSVRDVVNSSLKILGYKKAQVVSKAPHESSDRNFLEADNRKSIEFGVWNRTIRIEQTIVEMVDKTQG
jgi:GDPmannose 4,6-dehydratase